MKLKTIAILLIACCLAWAASAIPAATPISAKLVLILTAAWSLVVLILKALSLPEWRDLLGSVTWWVGLFQAVNLFLGFFGTALAEQITSLLAMILSTIMSLLLTRRLPFPVLLKVAAVNANPATYKAKYGTDMPRKMAA